MTALAVEQAVETNTDRIARLELRNQALEVEVAHLKQALQLIIASAQVVTTADMAFLK